MPNDMDRTIAAGYPDLGDKPRLEVPVRLNDEAVPMSNTAAAQIVGLFVDAGLVVLVIWVTIWLYRRLPESLRARLARAARRLPWFRGRGRHEVDGS